MLLFYYIIIPRPNNSLSLSLSLSRTTERENQRENDPFYFNEIVIGASEPPQPPALPREMVQKQRGQFFVIGGRGIARKSRSVNEALTIGAAHSRQPGCEREIGWQITKRTEGQTDRQTDRRLILQRLARPRSRRTGLAGFRGRPEPLGLACGAIPYLVIACTGFCSLENTLAKCRRR